MNPYKNYQLIENLLNYVVICNRNDSFQFSSRQKNVIYIDNKCFVKKVKKLRALRIYKFNASISEIDHTILQEIVFRVIGKAGTRCDGADRLVLSVFYFVPGA